MFSELCSSCFLLVCVFFFKIIVMQGNRTTSITFSSAFFFFVFYIVQLQNYLIFLFSCNGFNSKEAIFTGFGHLWTSKPLHSLWSTHPCGFWTLNNWEVGRYCVYAVVTKMHSFPWDNLNLWSVNLNLWKFSHKICFWDRDIMVCLGEVLRG